METEAESVVATGWEKKADGGSACCGWAMSFSGWQKCFGTR